VGENLKGTCVEGLYIRFYQKVAKRVNADVVKGRKRAAVQTFCLISKHIMIVNERHYVLQSWLHPMKWKG